jgi:hypothetical protein
MTRNLTSLAVLLVIASALSHSLPAVASPHGIYVRPLKVVLEPAADAATRVQIQGAISVGTAGADPIYATAACGYLYFQCPGGDEPFCQMDWARLLDASESGQCVSFGTFGGPARIRSASESPADPEPYGNLSRVVSVFPCQPKLTDQPDLSRACPVDGSKPAMSSGGCSAARGTSRGAGFWPLFVGLMIVPLLRRRRRGKLLDDFQDPSSGGRTDGKSSSDGGGPGEFGATNG